MSKKEKPFTESLLLSIPGRQESCSLLFMLLTPKLQLWKTENKKLSPKGHSSNSSFLILTWIKLKLPTDVQSNTTCLKRLNCNFRDYETTSLFQRQMESALETIFSSSQVWQYGTTVWLDTRVHSSFTTHKVKQKHTSADRSLFKHYH